MAETLTVALRVAEEAIDEAISKAEFDTSSQVIYVVHILLTVCHHAFMVGLLIYKTLWRHKILNYHKEIKTFLNSEWDA